MAFFCVYHKFVWPLLIHQRRIHRNKERLTWSTPDFTFSKALSQSYFAIYFSSSGSMGTSFESTAFWQRQSTRYQTFDGYASLIFFIPIAENEEFLAVAATPSLRRLLTPQHRWRVASFTKVRCNFQKCPALPLLYVCVQEGFPWVPSLWSFAIISKYRLKLHIRTVSTCSWRSYLSLDDWTGSWLSLLPWNGPSDQR